MTSLTIIESEIKDLHRIGVPLRIILGCAQPYVRTGRPAFLHTHAECDTSATPWELGAAPYMAVCDRCVPLGSPKHDHIEAALGLTDVVMVLDGLQQVVARTGTPWSWNVVDAAVFDLVDSVTDTSAAIRARAGFLDVTVRDELENVLDTLSEQATAAKRRFTAAWARYARPAPHTNRYLLAPRVSRLRAAFSMPARLARATHLAGSPVAAGGGVRGERDGWAVVAGFDPRRLPDWEQAVTEDLVVDLGPVTGEPPAVWSAFAAIYQVGTHDPTQALTTARTVIT